MAALVHAYTDPTVLSRVAPCPAMVLYAPVDAALFRGRMIAVIQVTDPAKRLTMFCRLGPGVDDFKLYPRIPTPPMGRMSVLTFPSIYRERVSSPTRPFEGQMAPRLEKIGAKGTVNTTPGDQPAIHR